MALEVMTDSNLNLLHFKKKLGRVFEVVSFCGSEFLKNRLKQMGLHPGQELIIVGQAPFSGPLLLRVGPIVMALRLEEAACIVVKERI